MKNRWIAEEKKEYVESLNTALKPLTDFKRIEYAKEGITEHEYIRLSDTIGGCAFLNVTGYSLEDILKSISTIVLGKIPSCNVTDIEVKRRIVKLFG